MKSWIFRLLVGRLGNVIGRNNLIRLGAFLERAGRLDVPNRIGENGESHVQEIVLSNAVGVEIVVVDCGANMGQWTRSIVACFGVEQRQSKLAVHCFEPSGYTFRRLEETLKTIETIGVELIAVKHALSNRIGTAALNIVHEGAGTNSIVGSPQGRLEGAETVRVQTMDSYAEEQKLSKIDLLKIDAEGHDFEVILGAEKLLDQKRINVIQFEYNWRWIYGRHFLCDVFDYLNCRDYAIGKVTPRGIQFYPAYDTGLETFVEGNYIACSRDLVQMFSEVSWWKSHISI